MLKMHFLALYYFISSFLFALNNLRVFKANIALLLPLPLFFYATKPLTSFILSLAIGFIALILVLLTLLSLRALSCFSFLMLLLSLSLKTRA
jgi:hypothetical protein